MNARELLAVIAVTGIVIVVSAAFHSTRRSYLSASILSAIISSLLFQVLSYLEDGHLAALWIIGLIMGTVWAFLGSLIIGIPFMIYRKREKGSSVSKGEQTPPSQQVKS